MDKIRQQKLREFLVQIDSSIKEMKNYLMLESGGPILDAIKKVEEENAEFLQYYSEGQDALNQRKTIIHFLLFPILDDLKVSELLQYHILDAIEAGLDIDELMRMRAISSSELLWPKISQEYLKALSQNTQLVGSQPLLIEGDRSSYLPYIKNWISAYNRRFGVEKHTGLEPHQFVLEDVNAQKLSKGTKETLLKILKFYENLKVYSLSEIESEIRKVQAYTLVPNQSNLPSGAGRSASQEKTRVSTEKPTSTNERVKEILKTPIPTPSRGQSAPVFGSDQRIKIMSNSYDNGDGNSQFGREKSEESVEENSIVIEKGHLLELLEKYPKLSEQRVTERPIRLAQAPFSMNATINNWVQLYFKECGKGRHTPQDRDSFIERILANQGFSQSETENLKLTLRSIDEKTLLPFDKQNNKILFEKISVGRKILSQEEKKPAATSPNLVGTIDSRGSLEKRAGYNNESDIELVPAKPIGHNDPQKPGM